jgi:hypothetical protein
MGIPLLMGKRQRFGQTAPIVVDPGPGDEDLTVPLVTPIGRSHGVIESLSVGLQPTGGVWTDVTAAQFQTDLQYLGFSEVRMSRVDTNQANQSRLMNLAGDVGYKANIIIDDVGAQTIESRWAHVKAAWNRIQVVRVEMANEPQNGGGWTPATWPLGVAATPTYTGASNDLPVNEVHAQQRRLHATVRGDADPVLSRIPIACSSLALRDQAAWWGSYARNRPVDGPVGERSFFSDFNFHMYQAGRRFRKKFTESRETAPETINAARAAFPESAAAPLLFSETGFHNFTGADSHNPTPEDVAGIYAADFPFEAATLGIGVISFHQMYNDDRHAAGREGYFGLFRAPGDPKPIADTLHRITGLYADPGATAVPLKPLRFSISGGGTDLRSQLRQRRDGSWDLALWRDVSIYTPATSIAAGTRLANPAPTNVTLKFSRARTVTGYTPYSAAAPTLAATTGTVVGSGPARQVVVPVDHNLRTLRIV